MNNPNKDGREVYSTKNKEASTKQIGPKYEWTEEDSLAERQGNAVSKMKTAGKRFKTQKTAKGR